MTSNTTANIITAIAATITAMGGLVVAVGLLVPTLRGVRQVHTIVNQQRTDMQRYNVALVEVLKLHGIDIPIDQSLPVTGHRDHSGQTAAVDVKIVNPDPVDVKLSE